MDYKKPDGYIAYSARHGFDKMTFRAKESQVSKLLDTAHCFEAPHPLDMGWQIIPVWFSTTQLMSKEINEND